MGRTAFSLLSPGALTVMSAYPDPPFEVNGDSPAGFDIELISAIAAELQLTIKLLRYEGADFNGIFKALKQKQCDVIISGTTVTPARAKEALFCNPYLRSGQSLVVNSKAMTNICSTDDLQGKNIGVQLGNTSQPVAMQLKAENKVAEVRVYAYDAIEKALDDVATEKIDAFMKLEPVVRWYAQYRNQLSVVQTGITKELLAIAVDSDNEVLADAINAAQNKLANNGKLQTIASKWLSLCDVKTTEVLL